MLHHLTILELLNLSLVSSVIAVTTKTHSICRTAVFPFPSAA
jgi:hypothetical protein